MEIVLVRHGQPDWVVDGRPVDDPGLSDLGHRQAAHVARALAEQAPFDELWLSPKVRTRQTAQPIIDALELEPSVVPDIREIELPPWSERPLADVKAFFGKARQRSLDQWWQGVPGGEAFETFRSRVIAALEGLLAEAGVTRGAGPLWDIDQPDRRCLLIGHGGTNAVIVEHLLMLEPVPWPWERLPHHHTGTTVLQSIPMAGARAFTMTQFDGHSHLPDGHRTGGA